MRIQVHVTPRGRANALTASRADGIVRIRVTAAPVDGAANETALALLRRRLGVEAGALRIVGGASSRRKWIEVAGLSEEELWRRLAANE